MMRRTTCRPARGAAAERGIVLFIAIVVLLITTIAGLALMRSTTSNVLVSGNLGFKRVATSAGDFGIEAARVWLLANVAASGSATRGYAPTWDTGFDPARFAWSTNALDALAVSPAGARPEGVADVRFVIHRLCASPGAVDDKTCVVDTGGAAASTQRGLGHGDAAFSGAASVLYRVTVRIVGAKGTTSYVQALVY
jgi:Tfp pilus assembly protein PilX